MTLLLSRIAILAVAGGLGAIARWGLQTWVQHTWPTRIALGTLGVNVLGCLLLGLLFSLFAERLPLDHHLRLFLLVGFLGSFTTYSTFALDSHLLYTGYGLLAALGGILLQVVLGWGGLVLGLLLGRLAS